jgi:hypothetical protein
MGVSCIETNLVSIPASSHEASVQDFPKKALSAILPIDPEKQDQTFYAIVPRTANDSTASKYFPDKRTAHMSCYQELLTIT